MAKGKTATITIPLNNMRTTTVSKEVELVVRDNRLVPDTNEENPGVNSRDLKN